jgi:D-alanyl-D-alanine dipeptidase
MPEYLSEINIDERTKRQVLIKHLRGAKVDRYDQGWWSFSLGSHLRFTGG